MTRPRDRVIAYRSRGLRGAPRAGGDDAARSADSIVPSEAEGRRPGQQPAAAVLKRSRRPRATATMRVQPMDRVVGTESKPLDNGRVMRLDVRSKLVVVFGIAVFRGKGDRRHTPCGRRPRNLGAMPAKPTVLRSKRLGTRVEPPATSSQSAEAGSRSVCAKNFEIDRTVARVGRGGSPLAHTHGEPVPGPLAPKPPPLHLRLRRKLAVVAAPPPVARIRPESAHRAYTLVQVQLHQWSPVAPKTPAMTRGARVRINLCVSKIVRQVAVPSGTFLPAAAAYTRP